MSYQHSILMVGLSASSLPKVSPRPGVPSGAELTAALDKAIATFNASGIYVENIGVDSTSIDGSSGNAMEAAVATLKAKIAEREWTAIQIGMGVRGNPSFSVFFEKAVECVAKETFGKGKSVIMGFPQKYDELPESVRRLGFEVME